MSTSRSCSSSNSSDSGLRASGSHISNTSGGCSFSVNYRTRISNIINSCNTHWSQCTLGILLDVCVSLYCLNRGRTQTSVFQSRHSDCVNVQGRGEAKREGLELCSTLFGSFTMVTNLLLIFGRLTVQTIKRRVNTLCENKD